jgi:hypothetical protein
VYWFFSVRDQKRFERADRIAISVAGVLWLAYAVHVIPHFHWFFEDLYSQMRFKTYVSAADGGPLSRLREPITLASLAALGIALFAARRFGARTGALGALCVGALVTSTFTQGWLYDVYPAFGALLASMLLLESGAAFAMQTPSNTGLSKLAGLAALIVIADATLVVRRPFLMRSVVTSTAEVWSLDPSYASAEEQYRVSEFLRGITPQVRTVSVQFLPDSDALLFESARSRTLKFVQQTFYVTQPDVYVLHRSPLFPPVVFEVEFMSFVLRNGVTLPLDQWQEIARGGEDGGSSWLVLRKLPGKIDWR